MSSFPASCTGVTYASRLRGIIIATRVFSGGKKSNSYDNYN